MSMMTSLVLDDSKSGPEIPGPVLLDFNLHQFVPLVKRISALFSVFFVFFKRFPVSCSENGRNPACEDKKMRNTQ
jgi:hypothetical protein